MIFFMSCMPSSAKDISQIIFICFIKVFLLRHSDDKICSLSFVQAPLAKYTQKSVEPFFSNLSALSVACVYFRVALIQ